MNTLRTPGVSTVLADTVTDLLFVFGFRERSIFYTAVFIHCYTQVRNRQSITISSSISSLYLPNLRCTPIISPSYATFAVRRRRRRRQRKRRGRRRPVESDLLALSFLCCIDIFHHGDSSAPSNNAAQLSTGTSQQHENNARLT